MADHLALGSIEHGNALGRDNPKGPILIFKSPPYEVTRQCAGRVGQMSVPVDPSRGPIHTVQTLIGTHPEDSIAILRDPINRAFQSIAVVFERLLFRIVPI